MAYSLPVLGWSATRLSDAYTFEQLNSLRLEVEAAGANPRHATGQEINLYTPAARRKLDALAWAVTHKLKEKKVA